MKVIKQEIENETTLAENKTKRIVTFIIEASVNTLTFFQMENKHFQHTQKYCLFFLFVLAGVVNSNGQQNRKPIHQLRVYEIFEDNKNAFHERFRDHAKRIMAKYDFKIIAIWESKSETAVEFVYLLEWPNEETMKEKWGQFMKDEEWIGIKKETGAKHGNLVGKITERVLVPMDYTPTVSFVK